VGEVRDGWYLSTLLDWVDMSSQEFPPMEGTVPLPYAHDERGKERADCPGRASRASRASEARGGTFKSGLAVVVKNGTVLR